MQPDGRLVVAGLSNSVPVITRLNEDGSRDGSFKLDPLFSQWWPNGEQGGVEALAVQPDGKILVAEWALWFTSDREHNYKNRLVRLNQDGSLDLTFRPPPELPVHIDYLHVLPDGRVFMADNPGGCHNDSQRRWYLHNNGKLVAANGSLDPQLTRVNIANRECGRFIASVALAPDGKLMVAGQFVTPGTNLIRLNVDGTLDLGFIARLPEGWDRVTAVAVQSDGRIVIALVSGNHFDESPTEKAVLARLLPDGQTDPSFVPAEEASRYSMINALVVSHHDKILIAPYLFFHGYSLRLKRDGALDLDLASVAASRGRVSSAVLDRADRVVGLLTARPSPNGATPWHQPYRFGRFFTHGATIPGIEFAQATYTVNEDEPAAMITLRRTGDISKPLSVRLTTQGGTAKGGTDYVARNEVVQFAADEEARSFRISILDDPAVEGNESVLLSLSEPGAGAVVSGRDSAVLTIADNEQPTSLDPAFHTEFDGVLLPWSMAPVVVQQDGKLIARNRSSNSVPLARLNPDGSTDPSFILPRFRHELPDEAVQAVAIQADGKLLAGGTFTNINNVSRTALVRLHSDGAVDTAFNPVFTKNTSTSSPALAVVSALAVQADGKILAGGSFSSVNGRRSRLLWKIRDAQLRRTRNHSNHRVRHSK